MLRVRTVALGAAKVSALGARSTCHGHSGRHVSNQERDIVGHAEWVCPITCNVLLPVTDG